MRLNTNIHVQGPDDLHGRWYGPDHGDSDVPAEAAALITAPGVWADETPAEAKPAVEKSPSPDDIIAAVHGGQPGEPPAPGWQDRAVAVLAAERERTRPRKTVIEPLEQALAEDAEREAGGDAGLI